ncbi:MAG: hypothetical protein LBB62_08110 [Proteiniphilum sp.]|nr:hypothetical protein [Proteiniphilum sp.]
MKKFLSMMVCAALLIAVTFVSCGDKDPVEEPPVTEDNLSGSIVDAKTLDASITYTITGPVIVEDGGVLNIPAGTQIRAKRGFSNYILVLQGGKINVNGTAAAPVVMTADTENALQGHWGGLIINGKAPLSGGSVGSTEINSAYNYGGNAAGDNSGVITYLVLAYTGARSSADVEHNGLTLNGVGSGTKIENVYIPDGADDGIEFFGGSVNVKNLLVVNPDDDMFDFTQGYNGTLENAYGVWEAGFVSSEADPRGIEADGNHDGNFPEHTGQSDFTVRNMTINLRLAAVTMGDADKPKRMQDVIKIRRGAKANVVNAVVKGTGTVEDLVDLSDSKGAAATGTAISITNSLTNAPQRLKYPTDASGITIETGNTGCPADIFAWTKYELQ